MSPQAVERYLHEHIPLSRAMEITVVSLGDEGIELAAPLEPNLNHRGTAFGGSVSSLAILSAWALLHVRLGAAGHPARIVIQKSGFDYLKPVTGAFTAFTPAPPAWERFLATLLRKGKARIALQGSLRCGGIEAGLFSGDYVALTGPSSGSISGKARGE